MNTSNSSQTIIDIDIISHTNYWKTDPTILFDYKYKPLFTEQATATINCMDLHSQNILQNFIHMKKIYDEYKPCP